MAPGTKRRVHAASERSTARYACTPDMFALHLGYETLRTIDWAYTTRGRFEDWIALIYNMLQMPRSAQRHYRLPDTTVELLRDKLSQNAVPLNVLCVKIPARTVRKSGPEGRHRSRRR